MSLQPQVFYLVPEETARVARAIFPTGNLVMRMYDKLGMLFHDGLVAIKWAYNGHLKLSTRGCSYSAFGVAVSELGKTDRLDLADNAGAATTAIAGLLPIQRVPSRTVASQTT